MKVFLNLSKNLTKIHLDTFKLYNSSPKKHFSHTNFYTNSNSKREFEYRVFLYKDKENIHKASFWHDIPYYNKEDATYNAVIEIPRGEVAKLELSRETFNPIKQDSKKNKITGEDYLRYYKLTPVFNYGFIPRTWENNKIHTIENYMGDNDPLDVVELSENKRYFVGQIIKLHIVGSFCLIDQGEVDWKILAVDSGLYSREQAMKYLDNSNNLQRVKDIQHWFKVYKTFEGKKENKIYHNDKIFSVEETKKIIEENHKFYMDLINCKS